MRIILITQSDPFYLAKNIDYLVSKLDVSSVIVGTVVFDVSPFGKKESFLQKTKRTLAIFGWQFFLHYSIRFILSKFNPSKNVKNILGKYNIPILNIANINSVFSLELLRSYKPDLLISIAGNQIFKEQLISLAPKGCLNLHTALLPKYRGLMPSFWVLKNGETETGVSVFFVDKGIDSGPILVQKSIVINKGMTQRELIESSKKVGMDAILEAIDLIQTGTYKLKKNPDNEKTYYTFPTKKDVKEFYQKGKKFF